MELIGVAGIQVPSTPIPFLIDTGASQTLLHPTDAITHVGLKQRRLALPAGWSKIASVGGVGGAAMVFIVECRYRFLQEDNTELAIDGHIQIAQWTPANERHPSLLGRDVLRRFRLEVCSQSGDVMLGPI